LKNWKQYRNSSCSYSWISEENEEDPEN